MLTGCNNEPDPDPCPEPELVELRENFSDAEFENAIIGTWKSAFEWEDNVNVMFLKIDCENNTEIHLEENGQSKIYVGDLNIQYVRPIGTGYVTRTQIIINTKDEEIILSDVGFGKNNMISAENLYLRNYGSPHATLEWGLD
jgi:hypothetical protein